MRSARFKGGLLVAGCSFGILLGYECIYNGGIDQLGTLFIVDVKN